MGHDVIRLHNMPFYGRHGVNPEEQTLGQRFEVDVEVVLDTRPAGRQDDLRLTVNYAHVYRAVKRIVEEERFALIEALAEAIAMQLGRRFQPDAIRVWVRKPHAPIQGVFDYVGVAIERTKETWQ